MNQYVKIIIKFVLIYVVCLVVRAVVAKEREKKSFLDNLKDKENQKTAGIVAITISMGDYFI